MTSTWWPFSWFSSETWNGGRIWEEMSQASDEGSAAVLSGVLKACVTKGGWKVEDGKQLCWTALLSEASGKQQAISCSIAGDNLSIFALCKEEKLTRIWQTTFSAIDANPRKEVLTRVYRQLPEGRIETAPVWQTSAVCSNLWKFCQHINQGFSSKHIEVVEELPADLNELLNAIQQKF